MKKVLIISGHPKLKESNANRIILEEIVNVDSNIEIRKLDELYSNDYIINIDEEQAALLAADIIVFQFPFYWYSVPAILKKYIDDVLCYGFAYGPEGDKLNGKEFLLSFTIGGPKDAYNPRGYNHFSIGKLLYPLEQASNLCGMSYNEPLFSYSMVYIPNVYNTLEEVEERAQSHTFKLLKRLNEIRNKNS
ncbi:NAD(P)H-dependent oxidoreductase [Lentisphaerota bacterium WC36G]|nr:NAD(P)H-dependent oxidoreductase [Lentisphaerae bacterium WC36]